MDRTDDPPETMESRDGRWVVAPDPRTGLFWRTALPDGFVAACGHAVHGGDRYTGRLTARASARPACGRDGRSLAPWSMHHRV